MAIVSCPVAWRVLVTRARCGDAFAQIRVTVLWDIVLSVAPVPGFPQCRVVGLAPTDYNDDSGSFADCDAGDVITPGSVRLQQLQVRTSPRPWYLLACGIRGGRYWL